MSQSPGSDSVRKFLSSMVSWLTKPQVTFEENNGPVEPDMLPSAAEAHTPINFYEVDMNEFVVTNQHVLAATTRHRRRKKRSSH